MSGGNILLETKNLSHIYSAKTPFQVDAISDVSVTIKKGDFVGIIGHTGSGKSTFVQHLNGLVKPTSGKILFDGVDIWEKPKEIRKIRFKIGLVFQYPEHQLFEDTAFKDIAFGPKNMGLGLAEIEQRVYRAAERAGLRRELLDKSPFELSGGEQRRVAIAGVFAMEPEVLILDEPTAGLDPLGRRKMLDQIIKYRKETGATIILVSHNMEDVARVTEKVMVMNKGRLAFFDETENIFSRGKELMDMGLNVPAVTEIFMKLKRAGYNVPENIYSIDKALDTLLPLIKGEKTFESDVVGGSFEGGFSLEKEGER